MTTVHEATKADIPYMVAAGQRLFYEARSLKFEFDPEKARKIGNDLIGTEYCVAFKMLNDNNEPIGFIMGIVYPALWGEHKQVVDVAVFIEKPYRNSGAGLMLIQAYVDECKRRGIEDIVIGISACINNESAKHVMEKIGFQSVGYLMQYMGQT